MTFLSPRSVHIALQPVIDPARGPSAHLPASAAPSCGANRLDQSAVLTKHAHNSSVLHLTLGYLPVPLYRVWINRGPASCSHTGLVCAAAGRIFPRFRRSGVKHERRCYAVEAHPHDSIPLAVMPISSLISAERTAWYTYTDGSSVSSAREFVGSGPFNFITRHRPQVQTKIGDLYIHEALSILGNIDDLSSFGDDPPEQVWLVPQRLRQARSLRDSLAKPPSLILFSLRAERYRRTAQTICEISRDLHAQILIRRVLIRGVTLHDQNIVLRRAERREAKAGLSGERAASGVILSVPFPRKTIGAHSPPTFHTSQ
ncbi:hypothetical protein FA95DRAFT_1561966, partial [Auriscalpium vulgare]